jgi:hypothetical protein
VKPRRVSNATASASPKAICMVVDVVGARPIGQASAACGSNNATSAARASVELPRAVIATSGSPKPPRMGYDIGQFSRFPGIGQRQYGVPGQDHAEVAMRRLGRMHKQRGCPG